MPDFTITLNNRKILDGFLELAGSFRPERARAQGTRQAGKIGRDGVIDELRRGAEAAGAGLTARTGRPGPRFRRSRPRRSRGARRWPGRGSKAARVPSRAWRIFRRSSIFSRPPAFRENAIAIDLGLARGLDYYTGIVFETTINGWEKFGSVASGGRYDNLASLFTPRRLPGVGASIGLDRLLALLEEAGKLSSAGDDGTGAGREFSRARTRPSPSAWRRGSEPLESEPRCIPTRFRSASRWDTARPAATNWR